MGGHAFLGAGPTRPVPEKLREEHGVGSVSWLTAARFTCAKRVRFPALSSHPRRHRGRYDGTQGHEDRGEERAHESGEAEPYRAEVVKQGDGEDFRDVGAASFGSVEKQLDGVKTAAGEDEVGAALDRAYPGRG